MRHAFCLLFGFLAYYFAPAQQQRQWSETDRQYLLRHLTATRDSLVQETKNLSEQQWNFKESSGRWSIKEIVEHICLWELLFQSEVSQALSAGPQPGWGKEVLPDSVLLGYTLGENPQVSTEYTKPFTFAVPMGLNRGPDNMAWFLKMRNESLAYVQGAGEDLRLYFLRPGRPNLHQVYIIVFGHTARHLRQLRKVKQHPQYPR